jgi:uncharacterized NAD-dependent epimerase/dehydratase family protein
MLNSQHRIALLMHEGVKKGRGKTGISLLRYGEMPIVAVIDAQTAGQSLVDLTGIDRAVPIVASVADAIAYQPDVLAIGIAPSGGALPEPWRQEVAVAVQQGLSVVNGLHTPMADDPELRSHLRDGQWIWDVRREPTGLSVGSGQAQSLSARRVLTVGTDMAVGKMSTSIELYRAARSAGLRSAFVATGQTGLMLGHPGVPLDAIRIDFASGAVEAAVLAQGQDKDIIFVEGQGSLMNPASTASLPLIRGSQPTHLILVHRAGMTHIQNFPQVSIPPLNAVIQVYESLATAGGSFAPAKVVAIALNTFGLTEADARQAIADVRDETQLPCTDVIRFGSDPILQAVLE